MGSEDGGRGQETSSYRCMGKVRNRSPLESWREQGFTDTLVLPGETDSEFLTSRGIRKQVCLAVRTKLVAVCTDHKLFQQRQRKTRLNSDCCPERLPWSLQHASWLRASFIVSQDSQKKGSKRGSGSFWFHKAWAKQSQSLPRFKGGDTNPISSWKECQGLCVHLFVSGKNALNTRVLRSVDQPHVSMLIQSADYQNPGSVMGKNIYQLDTRN